MRSLFLVLFFCLITFRGGASTNFGEAQVLSGETSDQVTLKIYQFEINKNKKNFAWPYAKETQDPEWGLAARHVESFAPNVSFQMTDLLLKGGWLLDSNQFLKAALGTSYLNGGSADNKTQMIGKIDYNLKWGNNSLSGVSVGQGHMTPMVISLSAPAKNMYSQNLSIYTDWNFFENWQISVKTRGDISEDRNQRYWFDGQIMYAFSKFPHWIRVGFGTTYLGYQFSTGQYWAPRRFSSYGPRADLSFNILKNFNYFLGGSYNLFQEDSFSPGDGYYLRTGLNWGNRNSHLITMSFENGESTQNNRLWYSHFYSLSLSIFW